MEQSPSPIIHPGGCNCGALRYELVGAPLFTHACHCTDCQTRAGSAFGLTMMVLADQFRLLQGSPRTRHYSGDSGTEKIAYFCGDCGVHIWNESAGRAGINGLRAGTLDRTDWVDVGAHIWTRSKQSWLWLGNDIPVFETDYDRNKVWPKESLRRLEDHTNKSG